MNHRLMTTKSLLLLVGLFVVFNAHGQSSLKPYKLTIFQDAAQVGWKGIIRFHQKQAEVPLTMDVSAEGMDIVPGTGDVRVNSFRIRQDTVITKGLVQNWPDVLRANISRKVTILYVIGNEFDEISGSVRLVNEQAGMLLLHGNDNSEYFIPLDQIKQVIVQTISDYKIDRKTVQEVLEISLDTDVPFVPMEMFTLEKNIYWQPVCRIRILGSDKARMQMLALIRNQAGELQDIEVELSTANILAKGQMDSDVIDLGKMSLRNGDEVMINFREAALTYESVYRTTIPWNLDFVDGEMHSFPVDNTLQFELPANDNFACDTYAVIDENNRNIANLGFSPAAESGKVALNLGEEKQLRVTLVEEQVKRSRKPEKIGNRLYDRVSVEGKIVCYNVGQKFIQLNLDRKIQGEVVETRKARITNSTVDKSMKTVRWRLSLDKGQKKEVSYKYDALVPNSEE